MHTATLAEGALRLGSKYISSSGYISGRVEIWHAGSWGTICNRAWSNNDGTVACQQMGYAGRDYRGLIHSFSGGSGPVHAQNLYCSSTYEWITQCFSSWGSSCSHSQDVGVYCESKSISSLEHACVCSHFYKNSLQALLCTDYYFHEVFLIYTSSLKGTFNTIAPTTHWTAV